MSRPIIIPVPCPACQNTQDFTAWESLNVTLDPERRAELLNGSLTRFTCSQCGHSAEVAYPMLYHDMEKQLMLWLMPEGEGPEDPEPPMPEMPGPAGSGYTYRRVGSRNELVEKVFVFDAGLDDRVIECVKLILSTQIPPEKAPPGTDLLFTRAEEDRQRLSFTLLAPDGPTGLSVPRDPLYEGCQRDFVEADPWPAEVIGWRRVDRGYAVELFGRVNDAAGPEAGAGHEPGDPEPPAARQNGDGPEPPPSSPEWWQFVRKP